MKKQKLSIISIASLVFIVLVSCTSANASIPPMPPPYIAEVAKVVIPTLKKGMEKSYESILANDLTISINGININLDKKSWVNLQKSKIEFLDRKVLSSVEGQSSILVIDRYDDYSKSPQFRETHANPRLLTRATLYGLKGDGLVHNINIIQSDGLMVSGVE